MHQRRAIDGAVGGFGQDAGSGFDDGEIAGHGCGNCGARAINRCASVANRNLGKPSGGFWRFLLPIA
jgi:hypothetical protein